MQCQGNQRELAGDAASFDQKGKKNVLIRFVGPCVTSEKLVFNFCQMDHVVHGRFKSFWVRIQ
jgi:hypothetical protein